MSNWLKLSPTKNRILYNANTSQYKSIDLCIDIENIQDIVKRQKKCIKLYVITLSKESISSIYGQKYL